MSSLPASYSAILSDLNRDVLRAQPTDPLQFCANWFNTRLEEERTVARLHAGPAAAGSSSFPASHQYRPSIDDSSMRGATPPASSRSGSGDANASHRDSAASIGSNKTLPPPSLAFNQGGYAFGGPLTSAGGTGSARPSPSTAEFPTTTGAGGPSGSSPRGSHVNKPSISSSLGGGAPDMTPTFRNPRSMSGVVGSAGGGRLSTTGTDTDEEVEDPRDDPNFHPGKPGAMGLFGGFGGSSGQSQQQQQQQQSNSLAIPVAYNLGRRTSVSAESLDPNAATQALPKTVIPKTASQRARIEKAIANNLLFRNLDQEQHDDVLNAMKEVTVQPGTEVIVQGAVGDFFYVVEEGTFEVWVRAAPTHSYAGPGQSLLTQPGEEKKVATYGPGGSFGELALMYNAPRAATVVATSRATMWALDRVTFRSILVEHTSRKRKMYEAFLGEVSILQELNAKERAKIADALEEKVYEEGEAVVVEGEVGKNFYIIESGKAEVTKRKRNAQGAVEDEVLGTLGKGDYFGELALINSAPRAATVRAKPGEGRLRVATLGEKAFTRLLGPIIDILARKAERSYGPGAAVGASATTTSAPSTSGAAASSSGGHERRESAFPISPAPAAGGDGRRGIAAGGGDA
ncbi:hypothetical protein C6P46_001241 [Rhodotorula mucilaginosa]|uniref:cAMP-dependent protein kinase regulatory subunit n=1 Tax=Rhodotorula mucilaginosa TaxID=5537 RepID=A0A9P6W7I6_RHOMI|nr:hypothetical protein C6P46_001241 [Rhodotorula mucilaginosa]